MALKKLVEEENEFPLVDAYSTKTPFSGECKSVPEGFHDIVNAVGDKLKGYCVFSESGYRIRGSPRGGRVFPRTWKAVIETENDQAIGIGIEQSYGQPGVFLTGAKAWVKYGPEILKKDLAIVREALTSSGLENVEA